MRLHFGVRNGIRLPRRHPQRLEPFAVSRRRPPRPAPKLEAASRRLEATKLNIPTLTGLAKRARASPCLRPVPSAQTTLDSLRLPCPLRSPLHHHCTAPPLQSTALVRRVSSQLTSPTFPLQGFSLACRSGLLFFSCFSLLGSHPPSFVLAAVSGLQKVTTVPATNTDHTHPTVVIASAASGLPYREFFLLLSPPVFIFILNLPP